MMLKYCFAFILSAHLLCAHTYTDMLGRKVEVTQASKLAFIGPGALRLGVYLGLHERLVGIEQMEKDGASLSPYRALLHTKNVALLPSIGVGGPGKMPDFEALVKLKPDVIIASFVDKNQLDLITSKTGIPVVALSYGASYGGTSKKNLQEIKNSLLLLGEVTQTTPKAQALVHFIQNQETRLSTIKLPSKKLYIAGVSYKGAQGITSTEAHYPPFELLGLKNSVLEGTNAQGHQFIDFEALLQNDPELIFIDVSSKAKIAQDYAEKKPLYESLRAYKNHQTKEVLSFNNYSTNVENLLLIAWQIAAILDEPIDIHLEANAIFDAFYGKDAKDVLEKLHDTMEPFL